MRNEYEKVSEKINEIITSISEYSDEKTVFDIQQINRNFTIKVEDFFKEGRKLNIGVIGRVKAGKSSFLNTLLFHGEEVLPKAATPKTATLTKMEYSDENRVVIEFYSEDEWEGIEEDAKFGDKNEITKSAKELVNMARDRGINVSDILSQVSIDKTFDDYSELLEFLNNYVGENGTYTPLVRSVIIYMNREEFKDISIVDTPGLNDPIPSRTQKTKEFIEVCDVVFFLSRAGSFLDVNDWELLCKQLPQKGVRKMVLVASQYDSGLRDVLKKEDKKSFLDNNGPAWRKNVKVDSKADNLADAKRIVATSLEGRVKEKIASFENQYGIESHNAILKILKECEKPILISSRAQDMSAKSIDQYSDEEKADYEYWKDFIEPDKMKSEFESIGNFEQIKAIYTAIKSEKKKLLEEKQKEFIPKVYMELKSYLCDLHKNIEFRMNCLETEDMDSLDEKQRFFEGKMSAVKAEVAEVFGDTIEKIKLQKLDINKALRDMSIEAARLDTHTGTETKHSSHTSYKFKLGPIKLGRHTEHYSYTTTYTYLAASDALEQVNIYGKNAASEIEDAFRQTVDMKSYRRKLLEAIIRNFDASDQNFDANYFRVVVQNALNTIEFPEVHIDVSQELAQISNQFSGEVRNSSEQERFKALLASTTERLYASIVTKVDETIRNFQSGMMSIQTTLCNDILENVLKEFDVIKKAIDEKESEIAKSRNYLRIIEDALSDI